MCPRYSGTLILTACYGNPLLLETLKEMQSIEMLRNSAEYWLSRHIEQADDGVDSDEMTV